MCSLVQQLYFCPTKCNCKNVRIVIITLLKVDVMTDFSIIGTLFRRTDPFVRFCNRFPFSMEEKKDPKFLSLLASDFGKRLFFFVIRNFSHFFQPLTERCCTFLTLRHLLYVKNCPSHLLKDLHTYIPAPFFSLLKSFFFFQSFFFLLNFRLNFNQWYTSSGRTMIYAFRFDCKVLRVS